MEPTVASFIAVVVGLQHLTGKCQNRLYYLSARVAGATPADINLRGQGTGLVVCLLKVAYSLVQEKAHLKPNLKLKYSPSAYSPDVSGLCDILDTFDLCLAELLGDLELLELDAVIGDVEMILKLVNIVRKEEVFIKDCLAATY
jgi:hypothetical protein